MASTSVHLPDELVAALDRLAAERGVSRNRLIVESCRRLVMGRLEWPDGYLAGSHLSVDDLEELRSGLEAFTAEVIARRHDRPEPPL